MKKIQTKLFGALALLAGLSFVTAAPTFAFDDDDKEKEESEESEEEEADEDTDDWLAVVGGDVYTGTGAVLRDATVLSKNGVIEEIGYEVEIPEGAETIKAEGMRVYPGLVAMSATSRLSRGLFAAQETMEVDDPSQIDPEAEQGETPLEEIDWLEAAYDATIRNLRADDDEGAVGRRPKRMDVEDGFDPFNPYLILALASGITTAEQSGSSIKLKRGTIEGVGMSEKYMTSFSWSNNSPSAKTKTRERLAGAAKYLREYRDWKSSGDKDAPEPSKKGVDTNALRVLQGEVWARFNANDRDELLGIARLAQRFNFRPVIYGAREGWTVASELGRAGAQIVLTPRTRADKDERFSRPGGSSIENAAKLHNAGCSIVVVPSNTAIDLSGIAGRDLMALNLEASFAVRGGMTDEEALAAITINPARLMGIDHRVGTLEIGKDCDLIITDGDVMHYETFVQWAVVHGKMSYDKQKETYFSHIRPRPMEPDPVDVGEEGEVIQDEEIVEEEEGDSEEAEEAEEEKKKKEPVDDL